MENRNDSRVGFYYILSIGLFVHSFARWLLSSSFSLKYSLDILTLFLQFYWKRASTYLSHSIAIYHRLHLRKVFTQSIRFSLRKKHFIEAIRSFRYAVNGHDDRIHSFHTELLLLLLSLPLKWRQILCLILFAHFIYAHFNFNQNIIAVSTHTVSEKRSARDWAKAVVKQKLKIGALHRHIARIYTHHGDYRIKYLCASVFGWEGEGIVLKQKKMIIIYIFLARMCRVYVGNNNAIIWKHLRPLWNYILSCNFL